MQPPTLYAVESSQPTTKKKHVILSENFLQNNLIVLSMMEERS